VQLESSVELEDIVNKTDGYSGADIALLCREAAYMPMRRKLKLEGGLGKKLNNLEWMKEFEKDVTVPLTMGDFLEAIKNVKPSVGKNDLADYEKWMTEFGEQGTN
jgi:SpoVK/Ycf46/Vps4 family AAA+-type ATPase